MPLNIAGPCRARLRNIVPSLGAPTLALLALACLSTPALAGAGNPNLSLIGQPRLVLVHGPDDPSSGRPVWSVGETELLLDDYLNPYVRGAAVFAYAEDEGLTLEEGYVDIVRGLPGTLNLRLGKWRSGFGKLNPQHPHVQPFAGRFGVLSTFLPGDESLNETGLEVSVRLPSPGDVAITAAVDWLQGDSFRRDREPSGMDNDPLLEAQDGDRAGEPRPAALGRLSAFAPVGERSGLELGLSATEGTNNVAAGTRTRVIGCDAKAKLWRSERSYLVLQAEALKLTREDAGWDGSGYTRGEVAPWGWYAFADWSLDPRWNLGASYERWQQDAVDPGWNRATGLFAGFALLEETTALRLDWRHEQPAADEAGVDSPAVDTVTLRVIWSMGPHKAHQF